MLFRSKKVDYAQWCGAYSTVERLANALHIAHQQGYGFAPALVYISAVALIGALSYILLVGDVKRVG